MTEKDLEIEELRRKLAKNDSLLRKALSDLVFVLNQRSLCEICEYADADCMPESCDCVPTWRGWNG